MGNYCNAIKGIFMENHKQQINILSSISDELLTLTTTTITALCASKYQQKSKIFHV